MKVEVINKEEANNFLIQENQEFRVLNEECFGLYDENLVSIICYRNNSIIYFYIQNAYENQKTFDFFYDNVISDLKKNQKYVINIYIKNEYQYLFENKNATLVATSSRISILDEAHHSLIESLLKIKKQVEYKCECVLSESDVAAVILDCNPMTIYDLDLIESLQKKHEYLIIFILEDDDFMFSFQERLSMVYLSMMPYKNVVVLPATNYLLSDAKFPKYFSHNTNMIEKANLDSRILRTFSKYLNINTMYINILNYCENQSDLYYDELKKINSSVEVVEIESSEKVRTLIKSSNFEEVLEYIPNSNKSIMSLLIRSK